MAETPDIFGVDLAGQLNAAFTGQVFPVVLNRVTTADDPNDSTNQIKTRTPHNGQGFVETRNINNRGGGLTRQTMRVISIFGSSLPVAITPQPSDEITINGTTSVIIPNGVTTDPAGAIYECVTQ